MLSKARVVPVAVYNKIESQPNRLVKVGYQDSITVSGSCQLSPLPRRVRILRLRGDSKITVNSNFEYQTLMKKMFCRVRSVDKVPKFDLSGAYFQVQLDLEWKKLVTISTHVDIHHFVSSVWNIRT